MKRFFNFLYALPFLLFYFLLIITAMWKFRGIFRGDMTVGESFYIISQWINKNSSYKI
jgi:hypothetical protein